MTEAGDNLLVCAATAMEMAVFPAHVPAERLVIGVGVPWALSTLYRHLYGLQAQGRPLPGLLLNIGIAGAYAGEAANIGDIYRADGEVYGDVGFGLPDAPGFRPVAGADFGRPFYADTLPTVLPDEWHAVDFAARTGRGCTVGACTGTMATGTLRHALFFASFETMEGAAVAQVGKEFGIPVCEIRAVSNIAADRDMKPENIRLALENLRAYLNACPAARRIGG